MSESDEENEKRDVTPDAEVTPERFVEWRHPRVGRSNPEPMTNPVWAWLIRSRISAWQAAQYFPEPAEETTELPGWCFDRFGQSSTRLPDGRTVFIAGEHEDYYDSDFRIYNDVVILDPQGGITIYGYPPEVFPPTDFHSATLVGDRVIVIGSLGYATERHPGSTPVRCLCLDTLAITSVVTTGPAPGWIHGHTATLEGNGASLLIRGGNLQTGDDRSRLLENIDNWRLHLADWRWERLTDRPWLCWEIGRRDGQTLHLWQVGMGVFYQERPSDPWARRQWEELKAQLGPGFDLDAAVAVYRELYRPEVPHEALPAVEEEYKVTRVRIEGVTVRYGEDRRTVRLTIEGELRQPLIDRLTADAVRKLAVIENTPVELTPLRGPAVRR